MGCEVVILRCEGRLDFYTGFWYTEGDSGNLSCFFWHYATGGMGFLKGCSGMWAGSFQPFFGTTRYVFIFGQVLVRSLDVFVYN